MVENKTISKKTQFSGLSKEFPILEQEVNGYPLVYLDNAATTQKPNSVIRSLEEYYSGFNSNIHRGVHTLANRATDAFEKTRKVAASFINANENELIITKGTTESINLVARTWAEQNLRSGDEILVSASEHHSNIVPWQLLAERKGCQIVKLPITSTGILDLGAFKKILNPRSKLLAINFVSNALGTINPLKEILKLARAYDCTTLVDAAQAAAHIPIDVQELDCDFLAFSGHKMYGPTGVGFLYGKYSILEKMPPFLGGGEMINEVSFDGSTFLDPPLRFEAGTPNIADVIAMKEAFDFLSALEMEDLRAHELELIEYSEARMKEIKGLRPFGTRTEKIALFSFTIDGIHPFDIGQLLDAKGIAVRTGHHCTMPLMSDLEIEGTVRASFGVYNSLQEAKKLWDAVEKIQKKYGGT
jgi:cysteine desulfurase / selenocysteine lyase